MKGLSLAVSSVLAAICMVYAPQLPAQEPGCVDTSMMGRMARANSPAELKERKQKAGDSYRAQVIFAARMLEIDPNNKSAAESLLNLIPESIESPHEAVWLELDELPECPSGGVPGSDLKALDLLQYHLPRLLARAALLVPDKLPDYVSYAYVSIQNPDSDYTEQMQRVCRVKHQLFVNAVDKLSPRDKKWFLSKIFNPDGCRPLHFAEQ